MTKNQTVFTRARISEKINWKNLKDHQPKDEFSTHNILSTFICKHAMFMKSWFHAQKHLCDQNNMTYFSVTDVDKDVRLECLMKCSMYVRDKEDVMCK